MDSKIAVDSHIRSLIAKVTEKQQQISHLAQKKHAVQCALEKEKHDFQTQEKCKILLHEQVDSLRIQNEEVRAKIFDLRAKLKTEKSNLCTLTLTNEALSRVIDERTHDLQQLKERHEKEISDLTLVLEEKRKFVDNAKLHTELNGFLTRMQQEIKQSKPSMPDSNMMDLS